jgi:hypothetical protein
MNLAEQFTWYEIGLGLSDPFVTLALYTLMEECGVTQR